jgi:hypothetical protein
VVGAVVCGKHGASAPQVRAKAAERVSLAEALLNGDHRHPQEVLSASLHTSDVLAERTVDAMAEGATAELVEQLLDANRTRATMAKLVLDAAGAEGWAAQEAYRQQGDALAKICREMARRLGHDPADQRVADAFEAAVAAVLYGRRRPRAGMKAIEGKAT